MAGGAGGVLGRWDGEGLRQRPVAATNAKSTHWVVRLLHADPEPDDPLAPGEDDIDAGNRIRIVLNNNDPRILQDTTYATSTVHLGPNGSYFVLPLAPVGTPVPEDGLREGLGMR